jgi:acyl transferase domain-containing protein
VVLQVGAAALDALRVASHCGNDLLSEVTASRWDMEEAAGMLGGLHAEVVSRVRHGVSIHNAELFERGLFSISAAEASAMDLQQRQLLERGYAALHDAGASQASRLGAIVGVAHVRRAGRWVRSGRGDRRVRLPTERGAAAVRMVGSAIRQDGRSTSLLMAPTSGQAQQGMLSAAPADAQLA